jgi:hypothetical protein
LPNNKSHPLTINHNLKSYHIEGRKKKKDVTISREIHNSVQPFQPVSVRSSSLNHVSDPRGFLRLHTEEGLKEKKGQKDTRTSHSCGVPS